MEESNQKRIEELFQRCVSLPPSEWNRYLEAHCEDSDLREAVEDLLLRDAPTGNRTRRFEPSWAIESDEDGSAVEWSEIIGAASAAAPDDSSAESSRPTSLTAEPDNPSTVGESDIFISYAAVDDQPLSVEKPGWISQFHRNLEVRIEQISGERVKIWRYPGPANTDQLDDSWLRSVPQAKTLVSIVSPSFVKSTGCQKQVEVFRDAAEHERNLGLESGSRVFKVVKHPVPPADIPPKLVEFFASLFGFEFFEIDPETGRVREYDDAFGQTAIQRYHERIYDLAREICGVLRTIREGVENESGLSSVGGATIYLATTTSDLEPQRNRVRRELLARGHSVLPDRPLPLVEAELVAAIEASLERCEFAVHTVGGMFGVVPEGTEQSMLEVQNRLAAEHAARRGLRRLIWIPGGIEIRDSRQERWIEALRTDHAQQKGAEVVEDRFDTIKTLLLRRLAEQAESARSPGRERPPRVYLICDRRDEQAVEEVEDFFFERGVEVSLPPFEASEAEAPEIHLEILRHCDAALIYYGAAGKHWVESHLRELSKASGYRDSGPIPVQAVYLAPPFDRRKERFRSLSVEVLRQGERFEPRVLDTLAVRVLEARTDG